MPGLLRAGRGLGPRVAAHPRGARRRSLRRHRPEDLVLVRPGRGLRRAARAHRSRREEARRDQLADAADGPARHRGPAAADRARFVRSSRAVPRRGAGAGVVPGRRGERRLAGHERHVVVRARHRVRERARRRDAARRRSRAAGEGSRAPPRARARRRGARRAVGAHEAQRHPVVARHTRGAVRS